MYGKSQQKRRNQMHFVALGEQSRFDRVGTGRVFLGGCRL